MTGAIAPISSTLEESEQLLSCLSLFQLSMNQEGELDEKMVSKCCSCTLFFLDILSNSEEHIDNAKSCLKFSCRLIELESNALKSVFEEEGISSKKKIEMISAKVASLQEKISRSLSSWNDCKSSISLLEPLRVSERVTIDPQQKINEENFSVYQMESRFSFTSQKERKSKKKHKQERDMEEEREQTNEDLV